MKRIAIAGVSVILSVSAIWAVALSFTTSEKSVISGLRSRIAALETQNAAQQVMLDDMDQGFVDLMAEDGALAQLNQMILDVDARVDQIEPAITLSGINEIVTCGSTTCTVDIEWSSDPPSAGHVEWGETTAYGHRTKGETRQLAYHKQRIGTFPRSDVKFHYRIIATVPGSPPTTSVDGLSA